MLTKTTRIGLIITLGLILGLGFGLVRGTAYAAGGDLDPSFSGDGKVTTSFYTTSYEYANALAIQPDGKIVAVGTVKLRNGDYDFGVARYHPSGSLDGSFGQNGVVSVDFFLNSLDFARAVAIQSDGKIIVAGSIQTQGTRSNFGLVRFNNDGSLDGSFGGGGWVNTDFNNDSGDVAFAVAIQPDSKIVAAGGTCGDSSNTCDFALARYLPNGTRDNSFDNDGRVITDFTFGNDSASGLVIQPDGKIVVAGTAYMGTTSGRDFALARYNIDGSPDTTFGFMGLGRDTVDFFGGDDRGNAVALQPDGKIVVAGVVFVSTGGDNFGWIRVVANGQLDTSFDIDGRQTADFGAGGNDGAAAVAVQADGMIVAAGYAPVNGSNDFTLARLDSIGNLDGTFGGGDGWLTTSFSGGNDAAGDMAIQADGKIVAAGYASTSFGLARYLSGNEPPTPTLTRTPTATAPTSTPTRTPTATRTPTPTDPCFLTNYQLATTEGAIEPGTTDIGNHFDDGVTQITLPFPFRLYEQTFTTANVSSNGNIQFQGDFTNYSNTCMPVTLPPFSYTILAYWDDLRTDGTTCSPGPCGIFTSVSGTAPNRIFNIEWRTFYHLIGGTANFEVRLYETPPVGTTSQFDVVYGTLSQGNTSATGGVQHNDLTGSNTQAFCNGAGQAATGVHRYTLPPCATATVTPTGTSTATASPTPTCVPGAGGGLLVGSGIAIGYQPNGYTQLANNTVNYTFANSQARPNEYAIFQDHDPWGFTTIKNAIISTGHTYSEFPPGLLLGFDFSQYRVVVLNWDEHDTYQFLNEYQAAIPALQAYMASGGVVWVQAAAQGGFGETFPMPFGGRGTLWTYSTNDVVANDNPMVAGVPDPFFGSFASYAQYTDLPAGAATVVVGGSGQEVPTLYEYRPSEACPPTTPTPTTTHTATPAATNTATPTPTYTSTAIATATATPSGPPNFSIAVTPPSNTVVRPGSVQYNVTLTSLNGFSGNVSLSVSGLPSQTAGSFNPQSVNLSPGGTGSSVLTITANGGGSRGTFTLTITGTSGATSHSQNVTLVITR